MKAIAKLIPSKTFKEAFDDIVVLGESRVDYPYVAVTQDIEVGDKVTVFENGKSESSVARKIGRKYIYFGNKTTIALLGETKVPKSMCFKVLGELSPNATWVKDGDEIEVDERIFMLNEGVGNWLGAWQGTQLITCPEKKFMAVKCPTCNTYH